MLIERRRITPQEQKKISGIAIIVLIVMFGILLLAFWTTQILRSQEYINQAQNNILDKIELKAPRGIIVDQNDQVIANNRLNFTLFLKNDRYEDVFKISNSILQEIGIGISDIKTKLVAFKLLPPHSLIPIKRNLSLRTVIYLEARPEIMSCFQIEVEPTRSYPFGPSSSHLLGFMGEVTAEELRQTKHQGYSLGDIIGKSGLERQYESYLKGKKGTRTVTKDYLGTIQQVIQETSPQIGATVKTTVDFALQQQIEQIFYGYIGTVTVVDLLDGGIAAMVSHPNFDPAVLTGVLTPQMWEKTISDPEHPLQNRFTQGVYSPGSVFKIVMSLAGLSEGIISPETQVLCNGSVSIYNRPFHCWQSAGHGTNNLAEALRVSCNIFFYQLGKRLDVDLIAYYAHLLGLGTETGIDLPNERNGIIPTKKWKEETKKQPWFPGETISVSIGGGLATVTPVQILEMISTIALRGKRPVLHFVKSIIKDGTTVFLHTPKFIDVPIDKRHFESVIEGLWRAVNKEGTARRADVPGLDICGKTGTQQIISKENPNYKTLSQQTSLKPHAWFASFAPRYNPRYAMVVFVENGGDAGQVAAPLAESVYRKLFFRGK